MTTPQITEVIISNLVPFGKEGPQGATGAQGATGPAGATGVQGATGIQGATGAQGPTGETGPQGATGIQGATGATGQTGPVGQTGPQGSTGATGISGDRYSTTSSTSLTIATGSQSLTIGTGLAYSIGQNVIIAYDISNDMTGNVTSYTSGTGALVVSVATINGSGTYSSWTVNLAGAVGAQGETGATGIQGPTGIQGATGPVGQTGPIGETGPVGVTGPVGATGATGPQGATGPIPNTGSFATTGSNTFVGNQSITGSGFFSGNLTVDGTLTAEKFVTEYVTSSVIYESGSTKFGDTSDDTHEFTGSLSVLGDSTFFGNQIVKSGSSVSAALYTTQFGEGLVIDAVDSGVIIKGGTSNIIENATYFEGIVSASAGITGSLQGNADTATSASHALNANNSISSSFATTASYAANVPDTASFAISSSNAISASFSETTNNINVASVGAVNQALPVPFLTESRLATGTGHRLFINPLLNSLIVSGGSGTTAGTVTISAISLGYASGSTNASLNKNGLTMQKNSGSYNQIFRMDAFPAINDIGAAVVALSANVNPGFVVASGSNSVTTAYVPLEFQGPATFTDGRVIANRLIQAKQGIEATASIKLTGSLDTTILTASGLIYPTTDGLEGQVIKTDGTADLSFGDVNTIFEDVYTGESVTKGDPLYVSGSQGATPVVYKADANVAAKMPVIYIASETIGAANITRGIVLGKISGIDLTGYTAGDEVYVAVGGGWTSTRPTGSAIVQLLGIVTKEGAGGQGLVLNPGPVELPNLTTGYAWIGNIDGVPTAVSTASLLVNTASFAISASWAPAATPSTLDSVLLTGSTAISGSPQGNVLALSISSNTASLDLAAASYYTLTLVSGSRTNINPSNIVAGKSFTIRIKQASTLSGSISFGSAFKFPTASGYLPTAVVNAEDIVSCITFDTASIYAVSTAQLS